MRKSQQGNSNTGEKNEEPQAEKIELIQAENEKSHDFKNIPHPFEGKMDSLMFDANSLLSQMVGEVEDWWDTAVEPERHWYCQHWTPNKPAETKTLLQQFCKDRNLQAPRIDHPMGKTARQSCGCGEDLEKRAGGISILGGLKTETGKGLMDLIQPQGQSCFEQPGVTHNQHHVKGLATNRVGLLFQLEKLEVPTKDKTMDRGRDTSKSMILQVFSSPNDPTKDWGEQHHPEGRTSAMGLKGD
ncbi:hypothetical protein WISP_39815 [Willisornis vidua]|uniref:Uncharacterized protein n=1 Tax=Willisornis vidua TaxID=1566151 RepID=A0ABQ9DLS1_9PASS|nr:hypothetical protein WISP_39815 [Willisornis vidua]